MADDPVGGSWRGSTWWASSCDKTGVQHALGETGGEGGGVGDSCDGMGLGCRGQDWCDGRGAHIAIPGGWTRAPLFGGGVPMSISPKDALKSVVTRTMDSFSKFSEHRDNANGYGLTVVGRENPANQNSSRRNSVMPPSCARQGGGRAPLARGWLRASIHEPTRRKDEDQQSDL